MIIYLMINCKVLILEIKLYLYHKNSGGKQIVNFKRIFELKSYESTQIHEKLPFFPYYMSL